MATTPSIQYCQEKTYPVGSSAYYAYLFVPEKQKETIQILYAFFNEVTQILYTASDSTVARAKIEWWKNEIHQLFQGKPEHPISQALVEPIKQYQLSQQFFTYIIESVEMDLTHNRYLDWVSLKKFCTMQTGAFTCLITQVLTTTTEDNIRFAQHIGVALHFASFLQNMGADAQQGRIYIPMDFLRQHNAIAADILNGQHTEAFQSLMQAQYLFVKDLFKEGLTYLSPNQRKALRPILIQINLSLKLLATLSKDNWQVLDKSMSLAPISQLFIATKTWISKRVYL
ncbi:squalene/phytoene synthase family protein [Pelistega sp. NLN82]|uniref:Squalene/phytoene synthase family protein n=1 Tax=Pelistega ratti TaxID=2652177 RepID=A0A6L9Y7M6_9BURK|nr:squalene/phytoene synthase family protein [Pelistega ratti]NEN76195.1 squalene/phytoene synthase family protein [Pelistega ratti]